MNRDVENDHVTDKIETAMMQMKNMDENMVVDSFRTQLPKNGCSGDLKLFSQVFLSLLIQHAWKLYGEN